MDAVDEESLRRYANLAGMKSRKKRPAASLPVSLKDDWELLQPLGEGGQGNVHLLRSLRGEPDAVIKFLNREDEYTLERFRREIAALSNIHHPNILRILKHELSPVPFYVAPKGQPFETYWADIVDSCETQVVFERSVGIIEQLAKGLAAVHAANLVHRDIKPENVIVFDGDRAVLVDFGIVHDPNASRITTVPAGTRFARNIESLYDPTLAPASGDCLCLANLWAWMLARDRDPRLRHGNYHWRFHRFVDDPRCEVVRTILALCSEPSACPRDASEFLELLQTRFAISELAMPESKDTAPRRAYLLAVAEREQQKVSTKSEMEVLCEAITTQLQLLVSELRDSARRLTDNKMPADLHVAGLSDPLSTSNILDAVLTSEKTHLSHRIAQLVCGDDSVMSFGVALYIVWHVLPHEDRSKFSLHVQYVHEASSLIDQTRSHHYKILPSGVIDGFDAVAVATAIREYFRDEEMVRVRTKPRPRGGGSFMS